MGELERLLKDNTDAINRNTAYMQTLTAKVETYIETSEKALEFHKELINKLVTFEQQMQKKWVDALLKWGGWIVAAVAGIIGTYFGVR